MHLTAVAGRLLFMEGTIVETLLRVDQQRLAVSTQPGSARVVITAVDAQHRADRLLLAGDARSLLLTADYRSAASLLVMIHPVPRIAQSSSIHWQRRRDPAPDIPKE